MSEPTSKVWKGIVQLLAGIGVAALALAWAFRDVSWPAVQAELARFSYATLVTYFLLQFGVHGVRIVRWWVLLQGLNAPSLRAVARATNLGVPASVFLPLRLGELVRPAVIARSGTGFSAALATLFVERVLDGWVSLLVFFCILPWAQLPLSFSGKGPVLFALAVGASGGGALVIVSALLAKERLLRWMSICLTPLPEKWRRRAQAALGTFLEGLRVVGAGRRILGYLGLTVLYWSLGWFATDLLIRSQLPGISPLAAPFTVSSVVFAMLLPAPAHAGTMEAGFRFGLGAFGVVPVTALAIALVSHLTQLLSFAILWGVGLASSHSDAPAHAR